MTDLKTKAEYAVAYANRGWPVVPLHYMAGETCSCKDGARCESPAKHPMTRNGLDDATTDVEQVEAVWNRVPDANIGLRTGVAFDVLDIDKLDAINTLQATVLEGAESTLGGVLLDDDPPVWFTGGGGLHVLYQPTGAGNRARMIDGVDWRGEGGYIVAPPSNHVDGGEGYYMGLDGLDREIPEAPALLVDFVMRRGRWAGERRNARSQEPMTRAQMMEALDAEHGSGGWNPSGLLETMSSAVEGERNHTLFWCACRVYTDYVDGNVDGDTAGDAIEALEDAARDLGLTDHEIERTVASAKRTVT